MSALAKIIKIFIENQNILNSINKNTSYINYLFERAEMKLFLEEVNNGFFLIAPSFYSLRNLIRKISLISLEKEKEKREANQSVPDSVENIEIQLHLSNFEYDDLDLNISGLNFWKNYIHRKKNNIICLKFKNEKEFSLVFEEFIKILIKFQHKIKPIQRVERDLFLTRHFN